MRGGGKKERIPPSFTAFTDYLKHTMDYCNRELKYS